jgi:hypothetical protein
VNLTLEQLWILAKVSIVIFGAGAAWALVKASARGNKEAAAEADRKAEAIGQHFDRHCEKQVESERALAYTLGEVNTTLKAIHEEQNHARAAMHQTRDEFGRRLSALEERLYEGTRPGGPG